MILLIDIGNTRIKWARLADGRIHDQSAAPHAQMNRDEFIHTVLDPPGRPDRVVAANVGGARIGELTAECVRQRWNIEAQFVQSTREACGVRNAYREPAKLGVDRWLALIAARAIERRAVCVASIGTAMTVDGLDADGRHLGGVIVPGPDLMVASLFRNTSDIAQRAQHGESTKALFADNTRAAVEQGAAHALAALIERAMETMASETKNQPVLILTGGASFRIETQLKLPASVVPDLVLRGLAVLADGDG
ncbi:MAG: type III pantothenate kinase [Steroidobacter sp.]